MTNPQKDFITGIKEEVESADTVDVKLDRYGYHIAGKHYRRTTSITGGGIAKPWLAAWKAKMVAEFAVHHIDIWKDLPTLQDKINLLKKHPDSKRDAAGARGTAVHNTLEALVNGDPIPEDLTEDELACSRAAAKFLQERNDKALSTEMTIFNPTLNYAGTLDLWTIDSNGQTWILDYKTSSGIYPEHAVQQIAYQNAEFAIVSKKVVQEGATQVWEGKVIPFHRSYAQRLGLVHVEPNRATLHEIAPDQHQHLYRTFRAADFMTKFLKDTSTFKGKTPTRQIFAEGIVTSTEGNK